MVDDLQCCLHINLTWNVICIRPLSVCEQAFRSPLPTPQPTPVPSPIPSPRHGGSPLSTPEQSVAVDTRLPASVLVTVPAPQPVLTDDEEFPSYAGIS